ncbi:filamentous hemagglutinin N-terminal domain-containing protein [Sphingomonas sp. OK281]|uniref:filamentous hemagglutinin N-terminal domain-containing protein n=1 Tax=Sphingomonas sp. OK281 TaxID=1881067 RepID=UPI0008E52DDA|nr:filamentous hemagglutinin N-terminal domain-containing protein [Sphingomonas sp. OK281]SFO46576.1 filamentous hemagglutinin family N-terminal domain-containing protein [Sphingomonas sp. OK281]
MSIPSYRRQIRRTLAISTVLASGCIPAVGWAQTLPRPSDVTAVTTSLGGGNPTVTRSGTTLSVDLKATSTVIDWNGFNVPTGATAEFTDGRAAGLSRNIAVLNRDLSGANTQILGSLKSDTNVAVWVFNPNGILVGSGAKINTGSLVLTTLKPDQANFLAGNDAGGSYGLMADGGIASDIRVQSGATITLSNGNRGLIMVAPKITSAGTLIAGNQDVAFVTATDVKLNYAPGSPLSVTLNKGTTVGGTSQLVTGSVSGRNVVFALASKGTITDSLLSVDATVTSASNGDNGIVLSAGRSGNGVTIGSDAAETGGVAGIGGAGAWRAVNDDVTLTANGAVALTGALRSGSDVVVKAGGLASIAGAVAASNDYRVTGTGVTLGAATPVVQSANDVVEILSTDGVLSGGAGLTLRANANGAGNDLMTLSTAGASGGNIIFAKGSSVEGGPNRESDVRIGVGVASNAVSLGDVSGRGLLGAVGGGAYTNGLSIGGALDLGDVTTRSALSLRSGDALTAGVLTSGGAITLNSIGAMRLAAIDASGDIAMNGSGTTTVSGGIVSRGTTSGITIARDGAVAVTGSLTAGGNLTIGTTAATVASIALDGAVSAGGISFVTSGAQTFGGTLRATGALTATAGGAVTSSGAVTAGNAVALTGASLDLNSVTSTNDDLTLVATSGSIAAIAPAGARLAAGGALSATASNGTVTVASGTANGGMLRLTGSGGVTVGTLIGSSDIIVDAAGSAAIVSGAVTAGRSYAVSGGSVSLGTTGSGSTGAVTQAARGAVQISGGAGGITGLDRLTLQANADGTGSEALELSIAATTPGAIAFAPGTTLRGGAGSQSDLVIRSGVAEGSVALGTVVARNLLGAVGTDAATTGLTRTSALSLGDVTLTGPLSLSGVGLVTGALTSDGAVTLNSSAGLTTRAINTAGAVAAVAAGDLTIASVRGDTGVALTSTGGAVDIAGALSAAVGSVSVVANVGAVRLPGSVTASGDYRVTGASVTLGGTQAAARAVSVAATAGTLTGASGLTLTSGSDGRSAQSLALSATGGIAFAANSVINGGPARQGAVTIDGGANAITLGDVTGRSLVVNAGQPLTGALTAGTILVADGLSITGGAAGIRLGDVSVSAGGLAIDAVDGAITLGNATVSGDVAVSGARIDYGTIDANAVGLRSVGTTATGIAGGHIDARGPVTLTATDGIGGVATGAINTRSTLAVTSVGEIRLDSVDASGTANLTTLTNPADVLIVNGLTAGGTVTIASTRDIRAPFITSTGGSLALSAPNGDVTGYLPGTTIQLNTGVDGGYALDVGRAVRLGVLTGGPVSLRADTIDVVSIDVGSNLVKLFADSGDLNVRNGIKAGLVDLRASGAVSVGGTINASDAVTLSGTTGLSFGGIRGLSVAASSGGAITGGAIQSTGAINLTGASLRVGSLASGTGAIMLGATSGTLDAGDLTAATGIDATAIGDLSVDSVAVSGGNANLATRTGDAWLGSGSASGNIVLGAGGLAASPGAILAGGNYQVTGGTVALGGSVTQEAGGRIAISATTGAIRGGNGLTLIANSPNGAASNAMLLDAAGSIDLAGSSIAVRNTGALGLRAGTGKTVTLGDIDAGLVGGIVTAADGSRSVSTLFGHDAAFTAGTIRAQDVGIALSAGDLTVDAVTTTRTTKLSAAGGAIRVGAITADTFTVDARDALTGGAYASTGDNSVTAGSIALTSLIASAGSTSAAARAGDIAIDTVTADGTATLTAPGAIAIGGLTATTLTATAGGALSGGGFTMAGPATLNGQTIALTGVTTSQGSLTATATGGDLSIARVDAGGLAKLTGTGGIAVDSLVAAALAVDAQGAVTGGSYVAKGAASVAGQSIRLAGLTSDTGDVSAAARRDGVSIDRFAAGGAATITAPGTIAIGALTANTLNVAAAGALTGGNFTTAGAASLAGQSIALTGVTTTRGPLTATATGGDLSIARVDAGGLAKLTGTGGIAVDSLVAAALAVDAQGAVTGGSYVAKGAASVAGQSIRLAGLTSDTGDVSAAARRDGVSIDRFAAGGAATITAPGTIAIGALTANTLNVAAAGALTGGTFTTAGAALLTGQSIALTGVTTTHGTLTATGGDLSIGRVDAGGLATLSGTGGIAVDALTAAALTVNARGGVSGGTYAVSGAGSVAGQAVTLSGLTSDTGDVTATARAGDLAITRLVAGGAATATASGAVAISEFSAKGVGAITATGGGIRLDTATASALTLKAAGDIAGRTVAGATLVSTGGDLTVTGDRAVTLAGATSAGGATIGGSDVRVSGGLGAARALLVQARNALTLGDATAGGTLSLTATSGLTAQALKAGGDTSLKAGAALAAGAIDTGGALSVTGGGDVSLASSRTSGAATIDAVGIATLGQMIAGPSLTIKASDARLSGIQRAAAVGFENRTGDTSALRLGDGTTADGFQLSDSEIKLVEADALTFRQGNGAVEIGTLAFDADAGRRTVDVLGTGRMTIDGVVSGAGAGRMFRFGGTSTSETDTASAIHVATTSVAGGRLLFDTADLDLRGNRIAVGLGAGFLNLLNDDATVTQVVAGLVGNANSALYNANLGGGAYDPSAPTTVSAHSLTVRYGDYALFQNTGVARTNTGIVLGGTPTAPVNPALSLRPTTAANTFAAFGTINGVGSTAAALLGPNAVSLGTANVSASRINGCVVGSGAGCLTAIVIQPTLQVFSASQADLFGSVADLTVPFDPLVGGSNEELLTGLAALAPKPDTDGCVAGNEESCK